MKTVVRRLLKFGAIATLALIGALVLVRGVLQIIPRPVDTTEPRVLSGDGATIDYCVQPELDGRGLRADDIAVAHTPECGYETFPMPVLADCREPLAPGVEDLRGLWQAYSGATGHIERIEQCGDRVVVTSSGTIHDIRADGTLANGANDVNASCMRIFAAGNWVDGVFELHPFGGPALVRRRIENGELVWDYPGIGTTRMRRICQML